MSAGKEKENMVNIERTNIRAQNLGGDRGVILLLDTDGYDEFWKRIKNGTIGELIGTLLNGKKLDSILDTMADHSEDRDFIIRLAKAHKSNPDLTIVSAMREIKNYMNKNSRDYYVNVFTPILGRNVGNSHIEFIHTLDGGKKRKGKTYRRKQTRKQTRKTNRRENMY
jgi:hypothetical protein